MPLKRVSIIVILLLSIALTAHAQKNVVNAQAVLSKDRLPIGSSFQLAVVLDIKKDFHTNTVTANPNLPADPAKLELSPVSGISFNKPRFPEKIIKEFPFAPGMKIPVYEGKITVLVDGKVSDSAKPGKQTIIAKFSYQPCSESMCFAPTAVTASVQSEIAPKGASAKDTHPEIFGQISGGGANSSSSTGSTSAASAFGRGKLMGLLIVFGMGFLLCLTPCVYPMIPVTIGYFGMQTEQRTVKLASLAGIYVLGLALSYSALGTFAALTGRMFGSVLQNPYIPLAITSVLVLLALSMFGLYEFRVPSFIAARSGGKQGPVGAFLMGILFGIVCAPCVGPFLAGLLLYVAQVGKPLFGFLTFFVMALGLGLPFFFLALFSGSLNKMPKAGMWMLSVRRAFGLLLIGAAVYYISPLLGRFISIKVANVALPVYVGAAGLYIGWVGSAFGKSKGARRVRQIIGTTLILVSAGVIMGNARSAPPMQFQPYSDAAVLEAARDGKPVMIDFAADWCMVCKELDKNTFPSPVVRAEGERFVKLRADQTLGNSPEVLVREKKYSITGLPTIVFIDSKGQVVESARVIGDIKPDELAKRMRSIR